MLTVAILAVLVAAACGPSASQVGQGSKGSGPTSAVKVYAKFAQMSGAQRHEALVKAAEDEGELVVYSSSSTLADKIAPAFEEKYGINVKFVEPDTAAKLRQRLLEEHRAGRVSNDVLEAEVWEMEHVYAPVDLLGKYRSDIRKSLPDQVLGDHWTGTYYYAYVVAWNTNLVKPGEQPNSFRDLADPKWKGKLGLVTDDWDWYYTLYHYFRGQGMSDEQFVEMFHGIAANGTASDGHVSSGGLLSAGDFAVIPNEYQNVMLREEEAPFGMLPLVEPVPIRLTSVAPMKDAQHPAAALLFIDYYLTEGQRFIVEDYEIPANPASVQGDPPSWLPKEDQMILIPAQKIDEETRNAWLEAYQNLLRGTGEVLPPKKDRA